jgi:putative NADH-flavin reductase
MKLTVFGATGRTGRHVLIQGEARGHELTAFTRRPAALPNPIALARVVTGDGRDPHAVMRAIAGAEAVIAIIGPPSRRGPHESADVARVILTAMAEADVSRLVITSAYPLVAREPRVPLAILRAVFAASYADARAMEDLVSSSDREWTIARLNRLTDRGARGDARVSVGLLEKPTPLTRAAAGSALLRLVEDEAHACRAVNLAGPG